MASIEKRLEQLERDVSQDGCRFFVVKVWEGSDQVHHDGCVFADLDSWKRSVGFQDSDHLTTIVYVKDWRAVGGR